MNPSLEAFPKFELGKSVSAEERRSLKSALAYFIEELLLTGQAGPALQKMRSSADLPFPSQCSTLGRVGLPGMTQMIYEKKETRILIGHASELLYHFISEDSDRTVLPWLFQCLKFSGLVERDTAYTAFYHLKLSNEEIKQGTSDLVASSVFNTSMAPLEGGITHLIQPLWALEILRALAGYSDEKLSFLKEGLKLRVEDVMEMLVPYQGENFLKPGPDEIKSYFNPSRSPIIHQLVVFVIWRLELPLGPYLDEVISFLETYSQDQTTHKIAETMAKTLTLGSFQLSPEHWSRVMSLSFGSSQTAVQRLIGKKPKSEDVR